VAASTIEWRFQGPVQGRGVDWSRQTIQYLWNFIGTLPIERNSYDEKTERWYTDSSNRNLHSNYLRRHSQVMHYRHPNGAADESIVHPQRSFSVEIDLGDRHHTEMGLWLYPKTLPFSGDWSVLNGPITTRLLRTHCGGWRGSGLIDIVASAETNEFGTRLGYIQALKHHLCIIAALHYAESIGLMPEEPSYAWVSDNTGFWTARNLRQLCRELCETELSREELQLLKSYFRGRTWQMLFRSTDPLVDATTSSPERRRSVVRGGQLPPAIEMLPSY
jgi:hypothetical protein